MDCDLIEKLLQTTGLSCDDLLNKLQQYRSGKEKTKQEDCATSKNNSVILTTKSSPVDTSKTDTIAIQKESQNINDTDNVVEESKAIENIAECPERVDDSVSIRLRFSENNDGEVFEGTESTNSRDKDEYCLEHCVPKNCKVAEEESRIAKDNFENNTKFSESQDMDDVSVASRHSESSDESIFENEESTKPPDKDKDSSKHCILENRKIIEDKIKIMKDNYSNNSKCSKKQDNNGDFVASGLSESRDELIFKNKIIEEKSKRGDNDVEDLPSFDFFKRNGSNRLKISDYLEKMLSCRKNVEIDEENVDQNGDARIAELESYDASPHSKSIDTPIFENDPPDKDKNSSVHNTGNPNIIEEKPKITRDANNSKYSERQDDDGVSLSSELSESNDEPILENEESTKLPDEDSSEQYISKNRIIFEKRPKIRDNYPNYLKYSEKQDSVASRLSERNEEPIFENLESPNLEDKNENRFEHWLSENRKIMEDKSKRDDFDVDDVSAFHFVKKNRSSKLKISDYLEKMLNCRKDDKLDNENVNQEMDATIEEKSERDYKVNHNVEKTVEDIEDAKSSSIETYNKIVNGQNLTILNEEKITNVSEHNYSNPRLNSSVEEETSAPKEVSEPSLKGEPLSNYDDESKTEEHLRDILKIQLSSLRNMKKSTGYLPDLKKTTMFYHNLKKKRKSCDINSGTLPNTDDEKEDSNDINEKKINSNENSIASLSDETDFVISSVTRGVDQMTPDSSAVDKEERMFAVVTDAKNKHTEHICLLKDENCSNGQDLTTHESQHRVDYGNVSKTLKTKTYCNYSQTGYTSDNEKLPNLTVKKNISENFKRDPGVNKSVKNSEKSPFVSDSLDDFLNESAQLKISYSIPKLGAEEGISERTKNGPFDNVVNKTEPPKIEQGAVRKEPKLVKAKTLAEMRRHFERMKAKETGGFDASFTSTPVSRYKKNKLLKKYNSKLKEELLKNEDQEKKSPRYRDSNRYDVASHRNSIVMYDNKKLWVSSRTSNEHIATVYSTFNKIGSHGNTVGFPKDIGSTPNRKPSLLSCLSQTKSNKVSYKPGPLCRKDNLQNKESRDEWITEVKNLPKVYLEVVPEVDKPIDPTLMHLVPIFDEAIITEERTNFALSVLKQKNKTPESQSFSFHVPYKNKQEQMIVRKPCAPTVYQGDPKNKETDPISDIAGVLNDLITYVETKEIEDTIIKEDDIIVEPNAVVEQGAKTRKHKTRRKKLDLELLRLNCKVIDVATNEAQDQNCSKAFCKLGCICKSLLCEGVFSNHCQLVDCMFGCQCSSVTPSEATTSNNSLSVHTVSHLEDKAKKNLAKVEREFTQTFIHTDNDAILVGTAKMRRSSKPPKKYTDYIAEDVLFDNPRPVVPVTTPSNKTCSVVLQKLDLSKIIPFCLAHNSYDCHCKGEAIVIPKRCDETEQIPKMRIVKTKNDYYKSWFKTYTKIRGTSPGFSIDKNKDLEEVNTDSINTVNANEPQTVKKPNKRKQSFNIREDITTKHYPPSKKEKEFALQRRKKKTKSPIIVAKEESLYNPVFDGEIKLMLKDNKEMLKVIGPQDQSLDYLRILPWTKLIYLFRTRKICIWAKENRTSVLLCNTAGHFPPKNFIDIRKVRDKTEFIEWILMDDLPQDRPRELMHLILTSKKFNFFIAGYCLKKPNEGDQTTITSVEVSKTSSETSTTDPLYVHVDPKSAGPSGYFEEVCVEDLNVNANVDDNSKTSSQENNKEIFPSFTLQPKISSDVNLESRSKQQSILINKFLEETESQSPMISSSKKQNRSDFSALPPQRRLRIIRPRPEIWIDKDTVSIKDPQLMTSSNATGTQKQNSPQIKTKRRYVKLKSILNNVPIMSDTPVVEGGASSETVVDGNTLKTLPKSQTSDALGKMLGKESGKLSSKSFLRLDNDTNTKFVEVGETYRELQRDPLEITSNDYTSFEPLTPPSSTREITDKVLESSLSENSLNGKQLNVENTKKRLREFMVIEIDKSTPSKQQASEPLDISPRQRHIPKRFKQNSPMINIDKNSISTQQSSRPLKCTHKDMYNKSKTLALTNRIFVKRQLVSSKGDLGTKILAPLPKLQKNLRWRMIYLNSDFSYLRFIEANYSIKYNDLMDVVKMSSSTRFTITLRSGEFCDNYKHPQFGIFCVPDYQDRLFIGPFSTTENHNIETLRYLQGKLIETQTFNKMVGKKNNDKDPVWVVEAAPRLLNLPRDIIIDITEDDEVSEVPVVDLDSDSSEETHQSKKRFPNSLLCPPFVEELSPDELKSRNVNRYIVTNIPHLGYFEACQRDSKAIEVFWPNGTTGYRFPNVTFAKNLLTHYLSQIFCPIPQQFKLNVIIMTNIDMQNNKPIDLKYFFQTGPYFCGEFGVYEKDAVSEDFLMQYKISSMDALIKWHEEAKDDEDAMIRIFGLFLMSNEELRIHSESNSILQWAISELYILKKLSENYESEKTDLQNMIRVNSQKMKEKRKEERSETVNNKDTGDISETIEIEDSDDDNLPQNEKNSWPAFKKITTSGKITPAIYITNKDRSLLKTNWQSLLKKNDKEGITELEKSTPAKPVKISLKNSKMFLNKNKLLVTKLK